MLYETTLVSSVNVKGGRSVAEKVVDGTLAKTNEVKIQFKWHEQGRDGKFTWGTPQPFNAEGIDAKHKIAFISFSADRYTFDDCGKKLPGVAVQLTAPPSEAQEKLDDAVAKAKTDVIKAQAALDASPNDGKLQANVATAQNAHDKAAVEAGKSREVIFLNDVRVFRDQPGAGLDLYKDVDIFVNNELFACSKDDKPVIVTVTYGIKERQTKSEADRYSKEAFPSLAATSLHSAEPGFRLLKLERDERLAFQNEVMKTMRDLKSEIASIKKSDPFLAGTDG